MNIKYFSIFKVIFKITIKYLGDFTLIYTVMNVFQLCMTTYGYFTHSALVWICFHSVWSVIVILPVLHYYECVSIVYDHIIAFGQLCACMTRITKFFRFSEYNNFVVYVGINRYTSKVILGTFFVWFSVSYRLSIFRLQNLVTSI